MKSIPTRCLMICLSLSVLPSCSRTEPTSTKYNVTVALPNEATPFKTPEDEWLAKKRADMMKNLPQVEDEVELAKVNADAKWIAKMIVTQADLESKCNGGSKTSCNKLEKNEHILFTRGWCFGKVDQGQAEYRYHKCESDSIQMQPDT